MQNSFVMDMPEHWWLLPVLSAASLSLIGFTAWWVKAPGVIPVHPWFPARLADWRRPRDPGMFGVAGVTLLGLSLAVVVPVLGPDQESGAPHAAASVVAQSAPLSRGFADDTMALPSPWSEAHRPIAAEFISGPGEPDRDWANLDARFRERLLRVLERSRGRGYEFVLIEGYRSPERQDHLFSLPTKVTSARAWESRHQYGLAADLAPLQDGRASFEADGPGLEAYRILGEEAEAAGLVWGGRWDIRDYGHVEMPERQTRDAG